jgi:hypothetical protein
MWVIFKLWLPYLLLPSAFHFTKIEILPAGEEGPRRLDESTVMNIHGIPFLTVSEFIRAKLKCWVMYAVILCFFLPSLKTTIPCSRRQEGDAQDIVYALTRYWNRVDINRIPEQDMNLFAARYAGAAAAWVQVKKKYGM